MSSKTKLLESDVAELDLFPMKRDHPLHPAPELTRRAEEEPISRVRIWNNNPAWLITRLEESKALLTDVKMSADARKPLYPAFTVSSAYASAEARRTILEMDEPEHGYFRRMLLSHFTVKRLERLRPEVRTIIDGLLDDIEAGPQPFDLIRSFALPLTSKVICGLMGASYDLADEFHAFAELSMKPDTTIDEYDAATARIHRHFEIEIERAREEPNEGLLSKLLEESVDTGRMSIDELMAHLDLIFVAGHDTTANTVVLGTLALLENPEQADLLRDSDDPMFIRNAVEDIVRYLSVGHYGMRRVATEDIELDGVRIQSGDPVIVTLQTANRDPKLVDEPNKLDFTRRMQSHVGFGFGLHQCLGQNLARLELSEAYPALLRRFPGLELGVPYEELQFNEDYIVYGMEALPLNTGR